MENLNNGMNNPNVGVQNFGNQNENMQNANYGNLLDVSAMDLEMENLDKEFVSQLQECDKQMRAIKALSQQIEDNYKQQTEIVGRYCDEIAKLVEKYDAIEEKEVAKRIKK